MKNKSNTINIISTVLLVIASVFFFFALVFSFIVRGEANKINRPMTGEMMLADVTLYGIENVAPYDIVTDVAEYRAYETKSTDSDTEFAIALADYRQAALLKYTYEYMGDDEKAGKYTSIMENARIHMPSTVYADYIDKNYENY